MVAIYHYKSNSKRTMISFKLAIYTTVLAFYMNVYKFPIFWKISPMWNPYTIFPWQDDGQVSKSTGDWLTLHLFVALFHVTMSMVWIVTHTQWFDQWHKGSHFMFTIIILPNMTHFGEASPLVAILSNGLPLAITTFLRLWNNHNSPYYRFRKMAYFFTLCSPVLLEDFLYITS